MWPYQTIHSSANTETCGTGEWSLTKTNAGPQAARIRATCCVPKGDGLESWANTSIKVDSAANVSTRKKDAWKKMRRQIADVSAGGGGIGLLTRPAEKQKINT